MSAMIIMIKYQLQAGINKNYKHYDSLNNYQNQQIRVPILHKSVSHSSNGKIKLLSILTCFTLDSSVASSAETYKSILKIFARAIMLTGIA